MGKKERKTYNLDSGIVKEFEQIAKKRGLKYSELLEQLLEQFIAKDGEMFVDDLYAPRLNELVQSTVRKEVDRACGMISNLHVDSNAVLIAVPALYKKLMQGLESTLENMLLENLLKEDTDREHPLVSHAWRNKTDGAQMLQALRNNSRTDIQSRRKLKQENG